MDLHENDYEDDEEYEDDYYDDEGEEYFTPKLSNDRKRVSQAFFGRNVVWYGAPGRMVYLTRDEVEGMWGNIYDERKLQSLVNLIRTYPDKVELECSYGSASVMGFLQIKE